MSATQLGALFLLASCLLPAYSLLEDGFAVAECGDGLVAGDEVCDDGNRDDGDECTNACTWAVCGDGVVGPGEGCDDGNQDDSDSCLTTCETAACGDGFVQKDVEECDDGNGDDADECPTTCRFATCGDGFVQSGVETCEVAQSGDDVDVLCRENCTYCGDGNLDGEYETCDDGNTVETDNCSSLCALSQRRVFVTSEGFVGDLGGATGADEKCANAAYLAGLVRPESFKAWLSGTNFDARDRLDNGFLGRYVLPGEPEAIVAVGWSGLTSGLLEHPINRDEFAFEVSGKFAWTSTDFTGYAWPPEDCADYTSASGALLGGVGDVSAIASDWTYSNSASCDSFHPIYCFEDPS